MTSSDVAAMIERLKERHADLSKSLFISDAKLFGQAAAMLAQLQAEREWQPIETAPKDGTHVIVGTFPIELGQITTTTAHWFDSRSYGAKSGGAEWALSVNYDGNHSDHGVKAPTHWMPLKAPP